MLLESDKRGLSEIRLKALHHVCMDVAHDPANELCEFCLFLHGLVQVGPLLCIYLVFSMGEITHKQMPIWFVLKMCFNISIMLVHSQVFYPGIITELASTLVDCSGIKFWFRLNF